MKSTEGLETNRVVASISDTMPRLLRRLPPFLILLITVVAFLPVLQNGFVDWEDDKTLLNNSNYRGLGWTQLRWMLTSFHMGQYQPLSWVSLALDHLLWWMDPFGYHLTSLFLHAANAVLFYFVTLRLLRLGRFPSAVPSDRTVRLAAAFAALIFAIHPLRVEVVAWASARNDVLSGFFFLSSIICYLRATTVPEPDRRWLWWLASSIIIYALSLLSKGSGITLPIILLVLDVYPLRRLGNSPGKWLGPASRRVYWEKLPFLLLALAALVLLALVAQYQAGTMRSLDPYGVLTRVSLAFFGLTFYLWKTVAPLGLSPIYELPRHLSLLDGSFIVSGLLVVAITIVLFVVRLRWPAGLASWVCYVVILVPPLWTAENGPQVVAHRYSYLSCLGWAVLSGAGLLYCSQVWVGRQVGRWTFPLVGGLAAVAVVGLGVLTWKQTEFWHDSERLWRSALNQSSMAHNNLALLLESQGRAAEAIEHYQQAVLMDPLYEDAHDNLAVLFNTLGRTEEAIEHYRRAVQINPAAIDARNELGILLAAAGRIEEAIEHFRKVVELSPDQTKTHFDLATALATKGQFDEAINHLQQAVEIKPDFAEAFHHLGIIFAAQGNLAKAIEYFRQTLRIQPEFAEAHESLGRALAEQGKRDEAVKHYQEALRIMKLRRETDRQR